MSKTIAFRVITPEEAALLYPGFATSSMPQESDRTIRVVTLEANGD
jgi:hypothetical protein